MEENKNIEQKTENTDVENNGVKEDKKAEKAEKKAEKKAERAAKKAAKPKKVKNQALLRRGGYSVAITAAVLAGIVVLNILVGALSKRFVLEYDMSTQKEILDSLEVDDQELAEEIKKLMFVFDDIVMVDDQTG